MNLSFLIDNSKIIGGGDYAMFKFAEHLSFLGHNVTIFAANRNEFLSDLKKNPNLTIYIRNELPRKVKGVGILNEVWDFIYTKFAVQTFLRRNKIDFVIGYLRKSAIKSVYLGKKFNIRKVNFIFEHPEWMKRELGDRFLKEYKGKFKRSWEKAKQAYLESDILIPISEIVRVECRKWLNIDIAEPVYPGIDIQPDENIKEENQIVYVGRFNELKNVDAIIKALSRIKDAPRLVLVGSGEEEQRLRRLAHALGVHILVKGRLTDREKMREISRSMFMVFPSSFEGFGMPPGEALACGKPCIVSDLPIFREIYRNHVEYFKEHDIEELREKIQMLLDNPSYRKKRGADGREFVRKRYTWEKSAEKLEKILSEK